MTPNVSLMDVSEQPPGKYLLIFEGGWVAIDRYTLDMPGVFRGYLNSSDDPIITFQRHTRWAVLARAVVKIALEEQAPPEHLELVAPPEQPGQYI